MSTAEANDWNDADLTGDPHVVLGRRRGRSIDAVRVDVHADLHAQMRNVCQKAIYDIGTTRARAFDSYATLEKGEEHFQLTRSEILRLSGVLSVATQAPVEADAMPEPQGREPEGADHEPALLACLAVPTDHPLVERNKFSEVNPFFYAVCFQQADDTWVSFIRKTNPQQFFKLGRVWCQYADALKRIDQEPTFALDPTVDVVAWGDQLVGFSETALKLLFTDARLSRSAVPDHVASLREAIKADLPLTEMAAQSLIAAGARRNTIATRIYGLAARLVELRESGPLTVDRFREIAGEDQEALGLLNDEEEVEFDQDKAEIFLDFIEGRYFEDDWTGTSMRADRLSRRRS